MAAQHFAKRFLEQMGRGVIFAGRGAFRGVHAQFHRIARLHHTAYDSADMARSSAGKIYRVLHTEYKRTVRTPDLARIRILSSHRRIKRRLSHKNRAGLPVGERLGDFRVRRHHRDLRRMDQTVISHKFRCDGRIDGLIHGRIRPHVICHFAGFARSLALHLHCRLKAGLVDGKTSFLQNLPGQICRKAERVIEPERIFAGKHLFSRSGKLRLHLFQNRKPLVDRPAEFFLFLRQHFINEFLLLVKLRITVFALRNHCRGETGHKASLDAQHPPVPCRAPDNTPEHITPALIRRHNTVRHHKCRRADMIRDQANGDIGERIRLIRRS